MKGFMKKILSAGLAFALVFTMCPVLAYADTPQEAQEKTAETTEVKATGAEAPEVETTEVKAESADEKNTVLVYGRIEGSQHWTKDNIYYIITDSTLINPVIIGDLTIDPGTTICFGQGNTSHGKIDQTDVKSASGLRILYGSLTAKGTAEEPIIFKNDTNDENWAGIIFDTQIEEDTERTCEGATFEYCQFINGGEYLASDVEGMLSVDSTSDETDRNFNLTVNQCTFDSSEVVAAKTAAGTSLVDGSSAIYFHAMDRKVEVKVTNSTFRGMGRALESTGTEYVYPENLSCLVEGNNFESDGYYNNTISEGMSYIEWSANAVVRNNTFHNTTGNELKGPACWLRGGCATYEVEGNHFIGNTDATGENANQYAPLKIRIGANVNADQTKAYAANTCNYGADIGKYAEVVRSTPEQPETITGQTGYLGKIEGLAYRLQGPTVDNARTVTIAPGVSLDESESAIENAGKQMQLDHLTIVGCNTGILYGCHVLPVIKNSIIAGNTTTLELQGTNAQEDKGKNITYSCLYGTAKDDSLNDYGTGCIAKDPCFADAASGDFHLKSAAGRWNGTTWVKDTVTSPCIDAGETSAAYANEPTPNGNRANMGAYGNTTEASKSASGGSTDPSDPSNPEQRCKHTGTEVRNQKAATCTTAGYTGDTYCKICNKKLSTGKSIAAKGHSTTTKTQKATASKDGKITTTCTRCGTTTKTVKIAKVSKIKLSKTKYTYNGKKQTPSVTVKDSKGKELKVNTDYKVKLPSGRKNVGTYEVKITFKGSKYSGSKTLSYTINPKSTKLSKVSAKKKGFEAKWEKQSTQTKGYQIQYSTDSKFKSGNKTVTVNKNSTTKKTISKLKAKKKYYVRIRTYKTVGKQKYYSDWSKSVKVTTKK